jgi:hypothetical protein
MWFRRRDFGGVAQLGERVNGIHEVRGSIPLASTDVPGVAAAATLQTSVVHQRSPVVPAVRRCGLASSDGLKWGG